MTHADVSDDGRWLRIPVHSGPFAHILWSCESPFCSRILRLKMAEGLGLGEGEANLW